MTLSPADFTLYNAILPGIHYCAEDLYQSDWNLEERIIGDHELIFVTGGEGTFRLGNENYTVQPNDLILLKPGVPHSASSVRLPFRFLCIHFDIYLSGANALLENLQSLRGTLSEPHQTIFYTKAGLDFPEYSKIEDSSYIYSLFIRIIKENETVKPGYSLVLNALFVELLINLLRTFAIPEHIAAPRAIHESIQYIKEHYAEPLELSQIASHVHLQPSYLSTLFKKTTGTTLKAYLMKYRMMLAKDLLLNSDLKLDVMAQNLGFYDIHHFSRCFKKVERLTPSQFRSIKQRK